MTVAMLMAPLAGAHDVITTKLTWSREISRIFYRHCAACHGEGGPAPMTLMKYDEARPWAVAIKEEVLNRRMPPWNAVKGFGEFKNDPSLTQEEITLISEWVEGGAPEGDPQLLPSAPHKHAEATSNAPRLRQKLVTSGTILTAPVTAVSIKPGQVKAGASVKIAAQRPDGTFEPLLWILRGEPKHPRAYEWIAPVVLPKGTRILISPPNAASFELLSK